MDPVKLVGKMRCSFDWDAFKEDYPDYNILLIPGIAILFLYDNKVGVAKLVCKKETINTTISSQFCCTARR